MILKSALLDLLLRYRLVILAPSVSMVPDLKFYKGSYPDPQHSGPNCLTRSDSSTTIEKIADTTPGGLTNLRNPLFWEF